MRTDMLVVPPAACDPLQPPPALVSFLQQRHLGVHRGSGFRRWLLKTCRLPVGAPHCLGCYFTRSFCCGATLHNFDQTSARAEPMALWYATPWTWLCLYDNQATVRRLSRGIARSVLGDAGGFWHQLLERWRPGSLVARVPSHGKDLTWRPPAHFPDEATCRAANAYADAEVSRSWGARCRC